MLHVSTETAKSNRRTCRVCNHLIEKGEVCLKISVLSGQYPTVGYVCKGCLRRFAIATLYQELQDKFGEPKAHGFAADGSLDFV